MSCSSACGWTSENSSTWRGTTIPVHLRGQEESHEQYDNKDVFKDVNDRRDGQREEGPSLVSENGEEEEDLGDNRQTRSQSGSSVEQGELRYVQRGTRQNHTD